MDAANSLHASALPFLFEKSGASSKWNDEEIGLDFTLTHFDIYGKYNENLIRFGKWELSKSEIRW